MLWNRIRKLIERRINKYQIQKNHVIYSEMPSINGRIVICHDRYLQQSNEFPNIIIGKNAFINSGKDNNRIGRGLISVLRTIDNGKIIIGDNLKMSNATIVAMNEVKIGNDVMIGGGATIWDTDFHSINFETRVHDPFNDIKTEKIIIDDGAFIGAGAYILKGVHIGKKSVFGAGSVVTRSIPDGEVWGGNPAKFIKKLECD